MATFESKIVWMDGEFIPWQEAKIHTFSHALHYGSGVFEGIRMYQNSKGSFIFRAIEHYKRLIESCKIYRLVPEYTVEQFIQITIDLIKANELKDAYIRPIVFRGLGSIGVSPLDCPIQTVIGAWSWGKYLGKEALEKGIEVGVSSWQRISANTLPSMAKACGHYLNSQLIKMEAIEKGYQEGIALDKNGYISEGSGENIFLVKDNVLYTPSFGSSILQGITRDSVIKIAEQLNIKVVEKTIPREMLYVADEIFFTGTAAEITPIVKVDGYSVDDAKVGKLTKEIQKTFFGIINGEIEDKHGWLYAVE